MPIEPIDLQVLFSRMLDVGKEQAAQNEQVNVAQSLQAGELVRQTEAQTSSVNETRETGAVEPAKGKGEGHPGEEEEEGKSKGKKQKRRPTFQDPELGRNIDIVG